MGERKRTDKDYIAFDPFSEDRDVDIQCHKVSIVTTRKPHWCSAGCLIDNDHNIEAGQRARRERAKVDGQFGTCYQCLPCLDKLMDLNS
jgi:hypothetical protein